MQKAKIMCLILAMVMASAGTVSIALDLTGNSAAPVMPDNAVNSVLDKPSEGTPFDYDAIKNLYVAQGELQRKGGFVGTTQGTAVSAGISQDVYNNRVVIGDKDNKKVFKEMITTGAVKNAYQLYLSGDNYLYRKFDSIKKPNIVKWADTASKYNEADFYEKFGHRSDSLTGYILNDETIKSGTLEKQENGLFTYRYVLDAEKSPARMLYEMKTNSNMSGFATFNKAEIVVTMDADWQVKSLTTDCIYKVPMFGGIKCVEDVTETFSDLTSDELPETEFFKKFFNAQTVTPVEPEKDALNILMEMFEPYIAGNNLNVSLNAVMDNQTLLTGLVSAKIDIENIENIEVSALLGNDLIVEYQHGKVYVTYQDFKASTTVDGIMDVVSAFMPASADVSGEDEDDDILSKFTYRESDGLCTVNLSLDIGNERLDVNIYANVVNGKYAFRNANVTLGSLSVNAEPLSNADIPAHSGDYPEILGLLDIVQNGVIYGNVNAFGMDVDVMIDLASASAYAKADDLSVNFQNETAYVDFGAIKAKLNVNEIDGIISLLRFAGVIDNDVSLQLPQISLDKVLAALSGISAVATDNGTVVTLNVDGFSAAIYLAVTDNGWSLNKVTVCFGENTVTLAPTSPFEDSVPDVNDSDYADVADVIQTFLPPSVELINASGYGADFQLDLVINGQIFKAEGSFVYDSDKNINVKATVFNAYATVIKADVTVANGIVYLNVNGLKVAFAAGNNASDGIDLAQVAAVAGGVSDDIKGLIDVVCGIANAVSNLKLEDVDFANVVKRFSYDNGVIGLTVNGGIIGIADVDVQLSVNNRGNLEVGLSGLKLANIELNANAAIRANVKKVAIPNASDYILNLAGNIAGIHFVLTADLLNTDISIKLNAFGYTVILRYVNGKIYATVGEAAFVAEANRLDVLVEQIMSVIKVDGTNVDMSSFASIDWSIQSLLSALRFDLNSATPSIGLEMEGLGNVSVNFDGEANFTNISANIMGYQAEIVKTTEQVPKLDLNDVYIPVEPLTMQFTEIYKNYKDVANSGISARLNANVTIGSKAYSLAVQLSYNNGLHFNAAIADNTNVLLVADMYLVNNVIYLDINGVRVATELATGNVSGAKVDIATVLGMLSKAKGYNGVLDSVIAVVEQIPEKLNGINYLDLISSVNYENGVLTAGINGDMLGLSKFNVSLAGTSDLALTLEGLAIGGVSIDEMTVNARPSCEIVTAPTNEYVTELEVEVAGLTVIAKLDLLNKEVVAKTTLLGRDLALLYKDGAVYARFGEISAKLDVANIDKLLSVISTFIEGELPSMDMGEIDVKEVLDSIGKTVNGNGYTLNVTVAGIDVALSMDSNAKFTTAKVGVNGVDVSVKAVEGKEYPSFDLNAQYVDLIDLVEQAAAIYNNYKNVLTSGIAANVNANVTIGNKAYGITAQLSYNNGLHLNVTVADNTNVLVAADMYLVNNVIYLDINGIRVAAELEANNSNTASVSLATVMGALTKAKGYNSVLDSVIDAVTSLPEKFDGINYVDLLGSLVYSNGKLTATINGSILDLSNFNVGLEGTSDVTVTLSNLAIGEVTIDGITVNATPVCSEVIAPADEYVTELEVEVAGLTVIAKLDLLNKEVVAKTTLLGHDLALLYKDGAVYLNYSGLNAMLNVCDIDKLTAVINMFTTVSLPSLDVDVKEVINSVAIVSSNNGYYINAQIAGINVIAKFDGKAIFTSASVNVNGTEITAKRIEGAGYPTVDTNADYVDVAVLAQTYASAIKNLIDANGYTVNLSGQITVGKHNYDVTAEVAYNNGLYVDANVMYNGVDMLKAQLWYVDNTLYAQIGDLKLAVKLENGNVANKSGSFDLSKLKGYNVYVDEIADVIQGIMDKFAAGAVDYANMLNGVTCNGNELTLIVNATGLGLSEFTVKLNANSGLNVTLSDLATANVNANIAASVAVNNTNVTAPTGDFTTNLAIKLDDLNTVYANLDLINGVYNFRLDDLYVIYSNKTVKINRKDMYLSGNVDKITEIFKKIDDLVNEFSGATESTVKIDFSMFSNIDVKAIVNSLTIKSVNNSVILGARMFNTDVNVAFTNGAISGVSAPIDIIVHKNVQVFACAQKQQYADFPAEANYIAIEQVFEDYFPAFEALVHTNSWKFDFEGDTLLTINKTNYMVAAGSYFEFYYKNTEGMDTFKLRAKLDVRKQKADNTWQEFMLLDIVYKDGNVYVSDTGRKVGNNARSTIRLTISVDTIVKCFDLYDQLVAVVPQIGELVDNMKEAMAEAEKNAELIQMSTILTDAYYNNGVFGLSLNGKALLSKLGVIVLQAQRAGDGLMLNNLQLSYDGISLNLNNMRVTASAITEVDGKTEYATVQDINAYDYNAYHMNFNSLYELLSSFVATAQPVEGSNGARSFYIDGNAVIKLTLGFDLADINMGLAVKVDIDPSNNVYISAKITRSNDKIIGIISAFDDKGGDSYLYFDGVNKVFSVIRNSYIEKTVYWEEEETYYYCTKHNIETWGKNYCQRCVTTSKYIEERTRIVQKSQQNDNFYQERDYAVYNIPEAEFTANIIDYIFEMINLNSKTKIPIANQTLEELIKDKITNNNNTNDFGIEDIFTNYTYTESARDYKVELNLKPIDSNLTSATLDIYHDEQFMLNRLTGDLALLGEMCTVKLDMGLKQPTYGETTQIVQQLLYW